MLYAPTVLACVHTVKFAVFNTKTHFFRHFYVMVKNEFFNFHNELSLCLAHFLNFASNIPISCQIILCDCFLNYFLAALKIQCVMNINNAWGSSRLQNSDKTDRGGFKESNAGSY